MPRIFTDEQFADGTTIDGTRIDRALEDMVGRVNRVPHGDLKRRWLPIPFCFGYQPDPAEVIQYPFQLIKKDLDAAYILAPFPESVANKYWVKGVYMDDTMLNVAGAAAAQRPWWVWTHAWEFIKPVIVDDIFIFLMIDAEYDNTFAVGTSYLSDFHVVATVDSPFAREDRVENAVIFARHGFRMEAEAWSNRTLVPTAIMQPSHPAAAVAGHAPLDGIAVHGRNLNIPLHGNARLRLQIVLPKGDAQGTGWPEPSWAQQVYTGCLTVLEEVQP